MSAVSDRATNSTQVSFKLRADRAERGQVVVLLIVLLAVLGGGWWMLKSSRDKREKEAWEFAREAATRIVVQHDIRFLDRTLSQEAQMMYPPSWRERLMDRIREPGAVKSEMRLRGTVLFNSQFFEPAAEFIAEWDTPTGPGSLDLKFSHPKAFWQIDGLNWTWQPPPPPTPSPTPSPSPLPSATASPKAKRK